MKFLGRDFFKLACSSTCIFGAILMVSYWFYKFGIEDRDIGVVDYIPFDEAKDLQRPNLAICHLNPVIKTKLKAINQSFTSLSYYNFLSGEALTNDFLKVNYSDVTLDLKNYFIYGYVLLPNGTFMRLNSSLVTHKIIYNGLYRGNTFVKCFTTEVDQGGIPNIKDLYLYYNKSKLNIEMNSNVINLYTNIYYPDQLLLETNRMRAHHVNSKINLIHDNVFSFEILKRRNSHNRRCLADVKSYDELVIKKHIQNIGCTPPHLTQFKEFSPCTKMEDIKKSKYDFDVLDKTFDSKPCQRISRFYDIIDRYPREKYSLVFGIVYPKEIKIISQSKEVDGHALIGNIGGYIGLFLGNIKS